MIFEDPAEKFSSFGINLLLRVAFPQSGDDNQTKFERKFIA